jgi:hypothetical protein
LLSASDLDLLDDNEYDAELLIEYLTWLANRDGGLDLGPPGSAKADGSLAADNEAAWQLVLADPRFKALGLSALDARMMTGSGGEVARAKFDAAKHPRIKSGKGGGEFAHSVTAAPDVNKLWQRLRAEVTIGTGNHEIDKRLELSQRATERGTAEGFFLASKYMGEAGVLADKAYGMSPKIGERYRALADQLRDVSGSDVVQAGTPRQAVTDYVNRAAPMIPGMVGGGHQAWNGSVDLFSTSDSTRLASMNWNASMEVREDVAQAVKDVQDHPEMPVTPEQAEYLGVPLHELIHGTVQGPYYAHGTDPMGHYYNNQAAYQEPGPKRIEEGFTELGMTMHAAEFFTAMGIGDRAAMGVKLDPATGKPMPAPDWPMAKAGPLETDLRDFHSQVGGMMFIGPSTVYTRIYDAANAVSNKDSLGALGMLAQSQAETTDPDVADRLGEYMDRVRELGPGRPHQTLAEYAATLDNPALIGNAADEGGVWHHYGSLVEDALTWTQAVAAEENPEAERDRRARNDRALAAAEKAGGDYGHKMEAWTAIMDAPPGGPRVRELADQVNTAGTEEKLTVMAGQAVDAIVKQHPELGGSRDSLTPNDWQVLRDQISGDWAGRGPMGTFVGVTETVTRWLSITQKNAAKGAS